MFDALHHLILSHTPVGFHSIASILISVFDIGQPEWSAAIDVTSEFGNGGFSIVAAVKFDHTSATRSTIGFILDLCSLDLANGGE